MCANYGCHYVDERELIRKPAQPSDAHFFNYATKKWELDVKLAWELVRFTRKQLLGACDWVVTKSIESGQSMTTEWGVYRQALRDITLQADPLNIVWPVAPT